MSERTYIGLDVHARSIVGCALNIDTREIKHIRFEDDLLGVSQWVQGFAPPGSGWSTRPGPPASGWPGISGPPASTA
ncbi:hypothetical protein ACSYDW_08370 [Paeniglutamicibacter sp. R2-26]|uniref:hypothetical protein n=1 Tax=Paeniglutamicibacter sp. R2-26 TaxID=3144417 RepID=UPI003EE63636